MRSTPLFACALLLAAAARAQVTVQTDMGDEGNAYVANAFAAYRTAHPGGACRAAGSGKRALVTGYGLFMGSPYNISGTIVRSMADPGFWPERVETGRSGNPLRAAPTPVGLTGSDNGGAAYNRSITIDGERFEACFLTLDVVWDLAAAIIVHEESFFKPQAVIMTGRWYDTLSVEGGAFNIASRSPGYGPDGRPLPGNTPRSEWVLPDDPVKNEIKMPWDSKALAKASDADARALGYDAVGQAGARRDNDYLCNNVSYVALHAAQHRPVTLAGGLIVLPPPELSKAPVTGFVHFPATDTKHRDLAAYGQGVYDWGRVLARTIRLASAP